MQSLCLAMPCHASYKPEGPLEPTDRVEQLKESVSHPRLGPAGRLDDEDLVLRGTWVGKWYRRLPVASGSIWRLALHFSCPLKEPIRGHEVRPGQSWAALGRNL